MNITAIVPYYGSKRTMAKQIIQQLGKHFAYWEPFCGSMAVLMQKPPSSHETVNDLNGDLINLARVIADEDNGAALYGMLAKVLCDEKVRDESVEWLRSATPAISIQDPIVWAYHYFIVSWLGRNGFVGTTGSSKASFAIRWTPNGGHGAHRFANAVDSIPEWHLRLRKVAILQRDAFDVLAKIDDNPKVAIYVDPPYLQKSTKYIHDFADTDHKRLADALVRFKQARVVVSYYQDSCLADLYPGWTVLDCSMNKAVCNAGKRGSSSSEAPEVLLLNGAVYE